MMDRVPNPLENQEIGYINTLNLYLRKTFGKKMVKLSLDGGFTCPNRDGKKGYGGCKFCSARGSGENASTIESQITLLSSKWKNACYIAYFQSFTNTYGRAEDLMRKYDQALKDPRIEGLAISTRPDCLPEEVLDLLSEYAEKTFLWVELGLQTVNPRTMADMNLCYDLRDYGRASFELVKRGIPFVTHILLGLPGDSRDDMIRTLDYAISSGSRGIKFHLFNLLKGTALADEMPDYEAFSSKEEYISLVADLLERTPSEVVIHRLSADSPLDILISPKWAYRKKLILDGIRNELINRNSYQGRLFNGL